jgi:carbon starvation protein
LCVGTTVIIKMGKARYAWVTLLPLAWLAIVTLTGGFIKIFSETPRLGFLSHAKLFEGLIAAGTLPPGVASLEAARRMVFNDYLDAAVAAFFMISVIVIIVASAYEWFCCVTGRKVAVSTEVEYSHTRDFVIQVAGGG